MLLRNIKLFFRHSLKKRRSKGEKVFWATACLIFVTYSFVRWTNDPLAIESSFIYIEPSNSYFRFMHNSEKKDWHDYKTIALESLRTGPGEYGEAVFVAEAEKELEEMIFKENKHNGLVSDKIARDRSIPDTRALECRSKKYLVDLPTVSVIIPFHNEVLSTLTRTIHSVFTRSPPELLKEVILVNDHSDKEYCYGPLEDYIKDHFDTNKIKIYVMPERSGLMWARLAGARAASGDVLVFMDCHTEANVNWLPPLIQPIAENYRTCACPLIDSIKCKTYKYSGFKRGSRGVFDWLFYFHHLRNNVRQDDNESDPFPTPVMIGCVFAISAKFFWELGGYDTGLAVWGGEQYEMSIKVWLCGGRQLNVPCSRVGHLYRSRPFTTIANNTDYCTKNYKRVAEIWMDEYKQYIYARDPERWNRVDPGDISRMQQLRKNLNCKPFKYFIEEIAPDMIELFPFVEAPTFASGAIQNLGSPQFCIDTLGVNRHESVKVEICKKNLEKIGQFFKLRSYRDILMDELNLFCFALADGKIVTNRCRHKQNNQYFRYDLDTRQIFCGRKQNNKCIELDPLAKSVFVSNCNESQTSQKWTWGIMNETMLRNWADFGQPILDEIESKLFKKS